jgi:hypothetical protein
MVIFCTTSFRSVYKVRSSRGHIGMHGLSPGTPSVRHKPTRARLALSCTSVWEDARDDDDDDLDNDLKKVMYIPFIRFCRLSLGV